jgi:hypothetical protein
MWWALVSVRELILYWLSIDSGRAGCPACPQQMSCSERQRCRDPEVWRNRLEGHVFEGSLQLAESDEEGVTLSLSRAAPLMQEYSDHHPVISIAYEKIRLREPR